MKRKAWRDAAKMTVEDKRESSTADALVCYRCFALPRRRERPRNPWHLVALGRAVEPRVNRQSGGPTECLTVR